MKIAILVIAAGASRRLGQPKQLLKHHNTSLLNHTLQECVASGIGEVHLVLGANIDQIKQQVNLNIPIYDNENWANGIGESIAFGIKKIMENSYDGVIVAVGDQPFFNRDILTAIMAKQRETKRQIIISKYDIGAGTPCFFDKQLFEELSQLHSDIGAKPIIKKYNNLVKTVDFPKGNIDIDTVADLKYLK
jgi:molybdenum cofactor cytidylyltransferase